MAKSNNNNKILLS